MPDIITFVCLRLPLGKFLQGTEPTLGGIGSAVRPHYRTNVPFGLIPVTSAQSRFPLVMLYVNHLSTLSVLPSNNQRRNNHSISDPSFGARGRIIIPLQHCSRLYNTGDYPGARQADSPRTTMLEVVCDKPDTRPVPLVRQK